MNSRPRFSLFALIPILLLAAFLRLYQLDTLPIAYFGDELDIAYQAQSLSQTLRDYSGHFLPIYLESLTEWRMPGLVYLLAPFFALFGPRLILVRLLPALLGVLNVLLIYLLSNRLFPKLKPSIGIFAALLLTITPWHLHYSRAAFDVTLQLSLLLSAALLFLSSSRARLFSLPLALLSVYVYPTSTLFLALFLPLGLVLHRPRLSPAFFRSILIPSLLSLLLLAPFIFSYLSGQAASRISGISIFSDPRLTDQLITTRTHPWVTSPQLERLFYNKPLVYLSTLTDQYLQAFSPQFLFISGDPHYRHSIGNFGQLFAFTAPLLLLGLYSLLRFPTRHSRFLLLSLLLSPLPAVLTQEGGMHATRLFLLLPPLIIISALGLTRLFSLLRPRLRPALSVLLLLMAAFTTLSYWHHYSTHYRRLSAPVWHYGFQDIFTALRPHLSSANRVFINHAYEPSLIPFAFYTQYPPTDFQNRPRHLPQDKIVPGFDGFQLNHNTYFGQLSPDSSLSHLLQPGDIYVAVQLHEIDGDWDWEKDPPPDFTVLHVTRNIYDQPLFTLVSRPPDPNP